MGCFATHLKMMARMIQNKDELALILEDDVDFEWSFKDTWREMFVELDKTWAIVCVIPGVTPSRLTHPTLTSRPHLFRLQLPRLHL